MVSINMCVKAPLSHGSRTIKRLTTNQKQLETTNDIQRPLDLLAQITKTLFGAKPYINHHWAIFRRWLSYSSVHHHDKWGPPCVPNTPWMDSIFTYTWRAFGVLGKGALLSVKMPVPMSLGCGVWWFGTQKRQELAQLSRSKAKTNSTIQKLLSPILDEFSGKKKSQNSTRQEAGCGEFSPRGQLDSGKRSKKII